MIKKVFFLYLIVSLILPSVLTAAKKHTKEEKVYIYFDRGEKLYKAEKYKQAVRYYSAAVKLKKDFVEAWKKIAFCYHALKKYPYAYKFFKKVNELDSSDRDAEDFINYYESITEKQKKKTKKREMFDSMWRSAALPGWGQFYNEQDIKGFVAGGAFFLSLGLSVYNIIDEQVKYDKYLRTNENHDIAYAEAESAYNAALMWVLITMGVYIGGIVDSAINYDNPGSGAVRAKIKGSTPVLCVNLRW